MTVAIAEHDVTVHQGDVRDALATLPAGSVQCIVTSPPYYGLRDYGTGQWEGGSDDCDHAMPAPNLNANFNERWGNASGQRKQETSKAQQFRDTCGKCGATRVDRQIGLEPSPAEYVETMRAVFAEARRVLADDGVMWLNLGDSYVGGGQSGGPSASSTLWGNGHRGGGAKMHDPASVIPRRGGASLPAKNLLGIPWRVAFALQDDGWTLRNAVIWHKPNAMPESVTDRLSTRYEHVFLFSKSRRYWFGLDAIREPHVTADRPLVPRGPQPEPGRWAAGAGLTIRHRTSDAAGVGRNSVGRNPGDVWTIATQPFAGAHFATMPPELVCRCILAGCPEGGTVLDPFAGSGTTLMVARQLARKAVGVELNPAYINLIRQRIGQEPFNFGEATA